jgi:hypothetical protein
MEGCVGWPEVIPFLVGPIPYRMYSKFVQFDLRIKKAEAVSTVYAIDNGNVGCIGAALGTESFMVLASSQNSLAPVCRPCVPRYLIPQQPGTCQ